MMEMWVSKLFKPEKSLISRFENVNIKALVVRDIKRLTKADSSDANAPS